MKTHVIESFGDRYELRWHGSVRQARKVGSKLWVNGHFFVDSKANAQADKWFRENRPLRPVRKDPKE